MAYVNLGKMPSAKKEYVASFQNLNGGLNLNELSYRIDNDESPEMKNLWWEDGVLCSRNGQVWVNSTSGGELHAAYERLWHKKMFTHSDTQIVMVDPETGEREIIYSGNYDFTVRGKFFPYNGKLYYKTKGYYIEIEHDDDDNFFADDVDPYVPVTYINCSALNGSGTAYQPENRLSAEKTLWYNALQNLTVTTSNSSLLVTVESAYFRMHIDMDGVYTFSYTNNGWRFLPTAEYVNLLDYGILVNGTPAVGDIIRVVLTSTYVYRLPIETEGVTKVVVDGVELDQEEFHSTASFAVEGITYNLDEATWRGKVTSTGEYEFEYAYNATPPTWKLGNTAVDISEYGITFSPSTPDLRLNDTITVNYIRGDYWTDGSQVTFFHAPPTHYPETNNTVQITYKKANEAAYDNIMDCTIVDVYGGTGALSIVMAGSTTQPNAYFWNGQTSVAMDATYFPMTQYQLAGDFSDPISGFGKQQGFLIIFNEGSVGRTTLGTTEIDGRLAIDMPYTPINAKIGCDFPYSIQLIENNLTWCSKADGVMFLANTSSAYENNIVCLSDKINDSSESWNAGLLKDLKGADKSIVISHDDDKRYWLAIGNHVWLWDYMVSNYKNPSWFYFTNVSARAFVQEDNVMWHFDRDSKLTKFQNIFYDYDPQYGGIDKVYKFATQYFGTYDNKKNINSVIINTRADTNSVIRVWWLSDYETREDLTPLEATAWRLVPRDLNFRNLKGAGYAHVFRRKPHCRRVQYFTMRLANKNAYEDMTIVSAQIYYVFEGRHR